MRTDGNDDKNIHYEFSGELVVSTLNSGFELDDPRPYLEFVDADELEVVNVTTRSAIAQYTPMIQSQQRSNYPRKEAVITRMLNRLQGRISSENRRLKDYATLCAQWKICLVRITHTTKTGC